MRTSDDMASVLQVTNAKAYVKICISVQPRFSVQGLSAGSDILLHLCQ